MKSRLTLNRRAFLKTTLQASGALLIQFKLSAKASNTDAGEHRFIPNGWLEIAKDNRFIFTLDKAELGQNVITSLTAIFAEELNMDYNQLEVHFPTLSSKPSNPLYKPSWGTGGSSSVRSLWLPLRHAGAATRALFGIAAAQHWQVSPQQIKHHNGVAHLHGSDKKLPYAELLSIASQLPAPDYELKSPDDFKQLGKPLQRYDAHAKAVGGARYGIDTKVAGQKYATLIRAPQLGARPVSFEAENSKAIDIVMIENGVAVIADSIWEAQRAQNSVKVKWQGSLAVSSGGLHVELKQKLQSEGTVAQDKGNAPTAIAESSNTLRAVYSVPLLAHAPMEPMNCTAWIHDGVCEVWAPTQRPSMARIAAQKASGYPLEKVVLHTSQIGGGFGRRLKQDYVTEAVAIAAQTPYPVQLIWSREDDMQHGFFRPAVHSAFHASLTNEGSIEAWQNQISSASNERQVSESAPASIKQRLIEMLRGAKNRFTGEPLIHNSTVEGAVNTPYASNHCQIAFNQVRTSIPVGAWRSVGNSYNAFFVESFIDELAHFAKRDPVEFRLQHMQAEEPRLAQTLKVAAERANWDQPNEESIFHGVACHACFGSYVSLVIKLSAENSRPVLKYITCVADCGFVIDPDGVKAQLEGAILFGLSAAMYGKIDIEDGKVLQSNFHDYQTLRLNECPEFDIHLIESSQTPGGVGEIGTPPAAPALVNAWFAATGKRVRDLPLIN